MITEKVVDEVLLGEFSRKGIKDSFGGVMLLVCQEFVPGNCSHVRKRPCMFLDRGCGQSDRLQQACRNHVDMVQV